MDNPLFLVTKGLKAKKKRLSGGGGGGISVGDKLISVTSKIAPVSNHSQVGLEIENMTIGQFYQDPNTGALIRGIEVSDYVAHLNSVGGVAPTLSNGSATLSAGNDYEIRPFAFYSGSSSISPSGTESLTVSVIKDTGNNVLAGNISINRLNIAGGISFNLNAPYRSPFGTNPRIEILGSASVGELIFKFHIAGGTTDTDANVIAGTAATSDAFYLEIILT
tara:strand:+ start:12271 stop:12933 length:663 start_codon:yes stop_codon:yes gene_type:complete